MSAARPRLPRLAVAIAFFGNGALYGTWAARVPAIKHALGLSDARLGLALLGIAVGALLAQPLSGWLVARGGSRATMTLSFLVSCVALPLTALAPNLPLLALALLLFGGSAGAVDVAMNTHGLAVEEGYARPILSAFHAAFSFGGLAGAAAGGLAAAADVGPRTNFAAAAALFALAILASWRWLLPRGADRDSGGAALARPRRRLAALGILAFCSLFAEGAMADWSAVYIAGPLRASAGVAAAGFAAFSLAMATGRLVGDRLTERWGPIGITRRGGVVAAGGLAAALLVGRPLAAVVGCACVGAGLATGIPVIFRAAGSVAGVPAGVAIAAVSTVGYVGFVVGPPAIGFASSVAGLPRALGLVVALVGALALLAPSTRTG